MTIIFSSVLAVYCDYFNSHKKADLQGTYYNYVNELNCTWHYRPCNCPYQLQSYKYVNTEGNNLYSFKSKVEGFLLHYVQELYHTEARQASFLKATIASNSCYPLLSFSGIAPFTYGSKHQDSSEFVPDLDRLPLHIHMNPSNISNSLPN